MIIISIFCFVFLFIYGINLLTSYLESRVLIKSSLNIKKINNIFVCFLFGIFVTFITQSSSAITAIIIAFLNAKQVTLKNAIAVLLGANIGTTFTSVLTSFDVDQYSYLVLCGGLFLSFFNKTKPISKLFIGLGFIFYSLFCLKNITTSFFEDFEYIYFLKKANNNILLSTWHGILLSGILQSSSVSIALAQICASNGTISLSAGICMVLGSNIGTTFTGLICSFKSSYESKILAVAHLLFNLFGVLFTLPFVQKISAIKTNNISLYLSIFHVLFNVVSCVVSLCFINSIIKLSKLIIKKEPNLSN